jgi:hypothetical protein
MSTQEITSLTVDEVCRILIECARTGASELQFRDLHVSFGAQATEIVEPHSSIAAEMAPNHEKMNQDALENDELALREEQMSLLAIENPMAFEQAIMDGELDEDERLDNEDDQEA